MNEENNMVSTRSASRTEEAANAATTTEAAAATTATLTTTIATVPTETTGAISRNTRIDEQASRVVIQDELESSGASRLTVATPPYSPISTRGIREAFRNTNISFRPRERNEQQLHAAENTSISRNDLRNFEERLLNLMPGLIQQNVMAQLRQQVHVPQPQVNFEFPDVSQPPPSMRSVGNTQLQLQQWSNPVNVNNNYRRTRMAGNNLNGGNNAFARDRDSANPSCVNENHEPAFQPGSPYSVQFPESRSQQVMPTNIRVDKWGIMFDGTTKTTSIEDFVFRVPFWAVSH